MEMRWGHGDLRHRTSATNKEARSGETRGDGDRGHGRTESTSSHADSEGIGLYTRETLSWRRMHASRAKLKETVVSSTLLCVFALECMVELQVQVPTQCPDWLFTLFAVNTTVLISVHVIATMISTYILPSIDSVCAEQEEWESSGLDPALWGVKPSESPHELMRGFIETAWIFSTVVGLFLFLTEVSLLSWVKFWDVSIPAAAYGSAAVVPFIVLCAAFCFRFHSILAGHTYEVRAMGLKQVEEIKERLDAAAAAGDSFA
ncbi:calcium release-activated calcium channel protein 1-like [Ischnura elegans]|uniref:calcium release-activated calcium channel protein 1-like n=1 Tax=Ischnura elegans TaxID=197161 RepID=UPI001ED8B2B3|nr:calcium release-activated calcium channel protein 1-like [Ischnura elegans]